MNRDAGEGFEDPVKVGVVEPQMICDVLDGNGIAVMVFNVFRGILYVV